MSLRRTDKRKKQTRLGFTPIPSSSPHKPEAHVRLEDGSTSQKRRRIISGLNSDSDVGNLSADVAQAIKLSKQDNQKIAEQSPCRKLDQLPTPEPSSQIEQSQENDSKTRHQRGVNAAKPIQSAATRSLFDDPHEFAPAVLEVVTPGRSSRRNRQIAIAEDSSSEDSDPVTPIAKRTRKGVNTLAASSTSEAEEEAEPKARLKCSRPPTARSFLAGGRSLSAVSPFMTALSDGDNKDLKSDDEFVTGSSGTAPIPRSRRRVSHLTPHKRVVNAESDSDSGQDETPRTLSKLQKEASSANAKLQKRKQKAEGEEDDEEGDTILTSSSRRHVRERRPEYREEDEDSMLEELGDLEDEEEPHRRRTRSRQDNSARRKRLEGLAKLKQRRAGVIEVSEDDENKKYEEESKDGSEFFDGELSTEEERAGKTLDDYESDFVEDDGQIGVDLMKHGVPLRFTGHANKKPFDYFKDEVEWMIHNKLDPAFERYDEIYEMAHQKLNDEVIALAGSEFRSSAWGEKFNKALQSRPEFFTTPIGLDFMEGKCQACNRSKHPPKWMITFSGPTYDRRSLEKASPKDTDESNSSSEDESNGAIEKEERWHVGSVCCGNAEIAHTLYHWRYQLNATILQWLGLNEYTKPAKIVERENWSRKKREKLANKVVDGMLESGEMKSLYQQFKQNLDAARAAKAERVER